MTEQNDTVEQSVKTTARQLLSLLQFKHKHYERNAVFKENVGAGMLAKSLQKYKELCTPVTAQTAAALLHSFEQPEYKNRFLAKSGQKMYFISCEDIRYFFAEDKIVYLIDRDGNKFTVDYTMEKLEKCLDPKVFFRLNRSYLVHQQSIFQIKPYVNSRFKLMLRSAGKQEEVILSRERVRDFKEWAEA